MPKLIIITQMRERERFWMFERRKGDNKHIFSNPSFDCFIQRKKRKFEKLENIVSQSTILQNTLVFIEMVSFERHWFNYYMFHKHYKWIEVKRKSFDVSALQNTIWLAFRLSLDNMQNPHWKCFLQQTKIPCLS